MLSQEVLRNNEVLSLKRIRPTKENPHYIDVPLVEVCTLMRCPFLSMHMALCVPLASSDTVVLPPKLIVTPYGVPSVWTLINQRQ